MHVIASFIKLRGHFMMLSIVCLMLWQQVGNTVIYMVELINTIQTISVGYGTITRDSPVRSEHLLGFLRNHFKFI